MFDHDFLDALRTTELDIVAGSLPPPPARLLEVGAGSGRQASILGSLGYEVSAIDVSASNYRDVQVFPVQEYDGATFPFADRSFEVVFSSNVLEHIPDLARTHREIRRVLATDGRAVHVVPTHAWRCWTTASAFPAALQKARADLLDHDRGGLERARRVARSLGSPLAQRRHGERGNLITEAWYFRPAWWRRHFEQEGFEIRADAPVGLFYTGHMVMGTHLPMNSRRRAAGLLGSACHLFDLRPTPTPGADPTARSATSRRA